VAGDTQHNENLALAVRCIGLVSCASINQQGWLRKNNPNKMFSNLMPPPTANEKPTPQVGTMRKRNQRLLHWLSQLGKPTTSPADQAFTHGAILFFLSQSPLSHNTARRLFFVQQRGTKNNGVTFCGRYQLVVSVPSLASIISLAWPGLYVPMIISLGTLELRCLI